MSIVQRAIATGQQTLRRLAGRSCTYVRRDGQKIPITARRAIVRDELSGDTSRPVRVERWRFTFPASSLVDSGQLVRPEEGDEIHAIVGTKRVVYRATPADDDEPCWGWNDSDERELFVDTVVYGED